MKKIMLLFVMLFGMNIVANAQDWFLTGTNKGVDGYITGGWMKKGWGVFAGLPHTELADKNANGITIPPGINTKTGTISDKMKFGVLRQIKEDKMILGLGIQPTALGNKPNAFIMYNPLRPGNTINLWAIGNLVGDNFSLGAGLSYKIKGKK
jgi:hypothetical protein